MIGYLMYVAIGLIPLGNVVRFDIGTGVALLPLDCAVALIGIVALPAHIRNWLSLRADPVFRCAVAFVAIGALSLAVHASWLTPLTTAISALYLARFVAYAQLIWAVGYVRKETQHRLLVWLAGAGLLSVVLGLGQYFLYPDLRNLFYAGWDEHVYRIFGTLLDPNFTGALYIAVLAILGMLHQHKLLYTKWRKPIIYISAGLACAIALTYSRSSYIAFIVFGNIVALLSGKKRLVGGILILFCVALGILSFNRSYESTNLFRTASIEARITEYTQAQAIIAEAPLLGVGFNAYRYAQLRHGYLDFDTWQQDHAGAGVPNSWLFVLATTGILGFIAYVGMWGYMLKNLLIRKEIYLIALFVALAVHALFENTLFYPYFMFLLFFLYSTTSQARTSSPS